MKLMPSDRSTARLSKFNYMLPAAAVAGFLIAARFILGGHAPVAPPQFAGDPGPGRYLTHIATDKPIYRTGEKVYVRGVALRADDHRPVSGNLLPGRMAAFEIKGPKGDTVTSGVSAMIDSVVGFSWDIPAAQAGGEYTVRILSPSGDAPAERKFDIRAYRAPRLKSQIVFVRDGYGPGDTVAASLHVERAEGGIPAGARVAVSARVDGAEVWKGETAVDASGNAGASFRLPGAIARGEGVIAMIVQDGGVVETATKTIPILLQTLDLAIYPEGGDLIAGLPNRVYLEGRTPSRKPADMAGAVVSAAGKEVAKFRTEHEGRGRFSFVPAKGESYSIRITEPAGIKTLFPLPSVKAAGIVLSSASDIIARQQDAVVRIAATEGGVYGVALTQAGKELSFKNVTLTASRSEDIAFSLPRNLDGVIVATVYDDRETPLAERLLFRQPEHGLKVQVAADRNDYVPGDKVTLRVTTKDDRGNPVGALVGLTVTDSSVLEMIEKREQAPRLPVMVLLENEVRNLSDAHLYLDETNPRAPLATDLLLGTQGWRRFATAGTGLLAGVITDRTNAVIPGVTVRARNTTTGAEIVATTDERGAYAFPAINSGTYQLTASLPGFRTESASGLQVAFHSKVRRNLQLEVASTAEEVTVASVKGGVLGGILGGVLQRVAPAAPVLVEKEGNRDDLAVILDKVEARPENRPAAPPVDGEKKQAQVERGDEIGGVGGARAIAGNFRAKDRREAVANTSTVREYAHALRPDWTEGSRIDFAETVYWNAGIRTDAVTGSVSVSFNLSDSVTSFSVLADGFTAEGALGSGVGSVESVQPFSIEPKIPLQVTSGDVIELPISLVNGMNRELHGAEVTAGGARGLKFAASAGNPFSLRPKERSRRLLEIAVGSEFSGGTDLTLDASAGGYRDSVSRKLDVQPLGFPYENTKGGILEGKSAQSFAFTLPDDMVRGSATSSATVYPTPLASMTDALQSLLRQPNGCFEQTSSTSYPLVMAQQYFLTHAGVDPGLIDKARDLLEASYKRLTSFESRTKGYEWFGADPGHEALTAYGLMQFTDMAQVRSVDKDMLDRTRSWLLSRRDGKGGFSKNPRALDSFGSAPENTTNAYIVWALLESGEKGLDREVAAVKASAAATPDSYVVALAANILQASGDPAGARQLMDKLATSQSASGDVKGAVTSITRSGGEALDIETTSLSVLAWLRDPSYAVNVGKGLKWILEENKGGRYGSTQSTILALRSIVAYDAANARPKAPGRLVLNVDGKVIGTAIAFTANTQGALVLPDFAGMLAPGKHTVTLRMEDGSSMPFSMAVKYYRALPDSAEQSEIGIQVALKDRQVQEGGVTEAIVSIANKSDQAIPTPLAIVGIPGGLEVRQDQLKELVKSGRIDAYEVNGREVVLYWRYIKAKDKFDIPLSLVAAVPGTYTGPASRAYLYYTDEYKSWAPGLKVSITPR